MASLSVILLTHNSGPLINRVLSQIRKVADEIIVVDDFSTDGTPVRIRKIASDAIFIKNKLENHGAQRNIGYAKAGGRWLAWADHDEIWSDELVEEIKRIKETDGDGFDGFAFLFKTPVLGGVIEDEWHVRLFRATHGRNTEAFHTTIAMKSDSRIKRIRRGSVLHLAWNGVDAWLPKHIFYSKMDAESYLARGLRVGPWHMIGMFFVAVLRRLRLVRQGPAGLVWALVASTSWLFKAAYLVEARAKRRAQRS